MDEQIFHNCRLHFAKFKAFLDFKLFFGGGGGGGNIKRPITTP